MGHRPVWIRRCTGCGADDLDLTSGQALVLEWVEVHWRCRVCGGDQWEATALVMPDIPDAGGCPYVTLPPA